MQRERHLILLIMVDKGVSLPVFLGRGDRRRQRAKKRPRVPQRAGEEDGLPMDDALGHEVPKEEEMVGRVGVLHHHHHRSQKEAAPKDSCNSSTRALGGTLTLS